MCRSCRNSFSIFCPPEAYFSHTFCFAGHLIPDLIWCDTAFCTFCFHFALKSSNSESWICAWFVLLAKNRRSEPFVFAVKKNIQPPSKATGEGVERAYRAAVKDGWACGPGWIVRPVGQKGCLGLWVRKDGEACGLGRMVRLVGREGWWGLWARKDG